MKMLSYHYPVGPQSAAILRDRSAGGTVRLAGNHPSRSGPVRKLSLRLRGYYRALDAVPALLKALFVEPAPSPPSPAKALFSFQKAKLSRHAAQSPLRAKIKPAPLLAATPSGTPLGDRLIAMLSDTIPARRISAAAILGETGDMYALVPLWPLLDDKNTHVKNAAQSAIHRICLRTDPQL